MFVPCAMLARHVCPECEPDNPAGRYASRCVEHRIRDSLPAHYYDCDRFQTYGYGARQGDCDCTATADFLALLASASTPVGSVYVQHKGSDLCADIVCPGCGARSHWDDEFMYAIRCPSCQKTLVLGDSLSIAVDDGTYKGVVRINPDDDGDTP